MHAMKSRGGYRFLPIEGPFSGAPFSAGVAAEPGFEIARVHAPRNTPLNEGFRIVERTLQSEARPIAALCATELRIPKPMTRKGFEEFNRAYVDQIQEWGLVDDGHVPVARTNVAPEIEPPAEPCLHAFCYAASGTSLRPTFVVSGAPEAVGTEGGLPGYWADMVKAIEERLGALGVEWADATETQFYGPRRAYELFARDQLPRLPEMARPGLRWVFSLPPIDDLNLEIDVRGLVRESWL